MGKMLVSKNTAFVVIICLFVSLVGVAAAAEQSTSLATSSSLEPDTENKTECDCGPYGECKLEEDGRKVCYCSPRYEDNNGVCEACDCGMEGICSFNQSVKKCRCLPEYGDKNGNCTECSCSILYDDGRKQRLRCSFENDVEKCQCPKGFKLENTTCTDIDECLIPSSCPNTTTCLNYPGGFLCLCIAGYTENNNDAQRYGCRDMDECAYDGCPHNESTSCVNTEGGFFCQCKPGYSRKYGSKHAIKALGCEKDGLGTGYIVLITVAVVVVVGAIAFVVKKRFFSHVRNPGYRTGI